MPIQVLVHIADSVLLEPHPELQRVIESIAQDHDCANGRISIAILSDPEIREINREYLEHDYETDVISFELSDSEDFLEGEIVISADTAARIASEVGWSAQSEMLLYAIHGMLHIVGYDDHEDEDRDEMRSQERHYLEQFQIEGWQNHPKCGEADLPGTDERDFASDDIK